MRDMKATARHQTTIIISKVFDESFRIDSKKMVRVRRFLLTMDTARDDWSWLKNQARRVTSFDALLFLLHPPPPLAWKWSIEERCSPENWPASTARAPSEQAGYYISNEIVFFFFFFFEFVWFKISSINVSFPRETRWKMYFHARETHLRMFPAERSLGVFRIIRKTHVLQVTF